MSKQMNFILATGRKLKQAIFHPVNAGRRITDTYRLDLRSAYEHSMMDSYYRTLIYIPLYIYMKHHSYASSHQSVYIFSRKVTIANEQRL